MNRTDQVKPRMLGNSGIAVSPIGYGAFKIGRNQKTKYADSYELPSDREVADLLDAVLDMGIRYIDTAPAYGISEQRIGQSISRRRDEFVLSTKVGEIFDDGRSTYDFSAEATRESIESSLRLLQTDVLDIVFVHSDGRDLAIQDETEVVATLEQMRSRGHIRQIGFSGKTPEGAARALDWADVLMVEYHLDDRSHEDVIAEAGRRGVGVVVKKGLASGRLPAETAIRFVLENRNVSSLVIGGLNPEHIRENLAIATAVTRDSAV